MVLEGHRGCIVTRTVGGQLTLTALSRLHFHSLDAATQQVAAIHRMAASAALSAEAAAVNDVEKAP